MLRRRGALYGLVRRRFAVVERLRVGLRRRAVEPLPLDLVGAQDGRVDGAQRHRRVRLQGRKVDDRRAVRRPAGERVVVLRRGGLRRRRARPRGGGAEERPFDAERGRPVLVVERDVHVKRLLHEPVVLSTGGVVEVAERRDTGIVAFALHHRGLGGERRAGDRVVRPGRVGRRVNEDLVAVARAVLARVDLVVVAVLRRDIAREVKLRAGRHVVELPLVEHRERGRQPHARYITCAVEEMGAGDARGERRTGEVERVRERGAPLEHAGTQFRQVGDRGRVEIDERGAAVERRLAIVVVVVKDGKARREPDSLKRRATRERAVLDVHDAGRDETFDRLAVLEAAPLQLRDAAWQVNEALDGFVPALVDRLEARATAERVGCERPREPGRNLDGLQGRASAERGTGRDAPQRREMDLLQKRVAGEGVAVARDGRHGRREDVRDLRLVEVVAAEGRDARRQLDVADDLRRVVRVERRERRAAAERVGTEGRHVRRDLELHERRAVLKCTVACNVLEIGAIDVDERRATAESALVHLRHAGHRRRLKGRAAVEGVVADGRDPRRQDECLDYLVVLEALVPDVGERHRMGRRLGGKVLVDGRKVERRAAALPSADVVGASILDELDPPRAVRGPDVVSVVSVVGPRGGRRRGGDGAEEREEGENPFHVGHPFSSRPRARLSSGNRGPRSGASRTCSIASGRSNRRPIPPSPRRGSGT